MNSKTMHVSKITTLIATVAVLGLFTGCPAGEETQVSQSERSESRAEPKEGPEPEGEPVTITITGNDTMKFDPTEFTVKARQPVTIVFQNVGTMPKESMGHNVVVLDQGVDKLEFATAGARHVRNEYIDPNRMNEVLAYTPIIGPKKEVEVSFTAPADTGDYDYICTFPGHAAAGMVGVMSVE